MDVSLIICTRNRAAQLAIALEKLLCVRLDEIAFELVVVDNHSTDTTAATLSDFTQKAPFPVLICREEKPGLGRARNRGIHAATADLLVFSDDDCYFDPGYFKALVQFFDAKLYGFGGGQILLASQEDDPRVAHMALRERQVIPAGSYFLKPGLIQGANIFFHRRVFDRVGYFRPDMGAGTSFPCEDIEMACRASWAGFAGVLLPELKVFHDHGRRLNSPQARQAIASYDQGRGAYYASLFCEGKVDVLNIWSQRYTSLPLLRRRHFRMLARELRAAADLIDAKKMATSFTLTPIHEPVQRAAPVALSATDAEPSLNPSDPRPPVSPSPGLTPSSPTIPRTLAPQTSASADAAALRVHHGSDPSDASRPPQLVKIFGIGLNKTGTTTLGSCLQILGFRHSSFDLQLLEQAACGNLEPLFQTVISHDSFEDWPYPLLYEQLDRRFPGSRFVLSRRSSPERWLASLSAHALRTDPLIGSRCRSLTYGLPFPQLDPGLHLERYEAHLEQVRAYFRNRPADLLEVCWEEEARWEPLCTFLDRPVPDVPFPHANAAHPPDPDHLRRNTALIAWHRRLRGATLV